MAEDRVTSSNHSQKMKDNPRDSGLTSEQAELQYQQYGYNQLPAQPTTSFWWRLFQQFKNPLIYILLFAFVIDITLWLFEDVSNWPLESIAIGVILLLNAGLGVWQENKAESALTKLKDLSTPLVWVMRDGHLSHLGIEKLVPDDIIRLETGERIPADAMLISDDELLIDESILTGESLPLQKTVEHELYAGSLIIRGRAYARVSRTGSQSTMGKLANLLDDIDEEKTPLEIRLNKFGKKIALVVTVIACLLVFLGTWLEGLSAFNQIFLFAIALAVAAVPEGLPAVITLTLSLGTERMAKRKAIVRRLSAVEALGSVTVIATDKTGTLTENKMHVKDIISEDFNRCYRAMALANDAEIDTGAGDTLELGLYRFLMKNNVSAAALQKQYPRLSSTAFDSTNKYMRVTVNEDNNKVSYLKGAPEVLLERSELTTSELKLWMDKSNQYASKGYRILALAYGEGEVEENLKFLGLILLGDPPRKEVAGAIKQAQQAGIRVLMITGDHPSTALTIAKQIGIESGSGQDKVITGSELDQMDEASLFEVVANINVFARVKPEHKLTIVQTLRTQKQVIAVTGDGVNDAPALKAADVGVAMGIRGSDVSREVADLVLMDDNFATIVEAIKEGRNIFENIKKFIRFMFAANLAEVLLITIGVSISMVMGFEYLDGSILLPLTAVQILWINLLTDSFPALALALDKNKGVMNWNPMPRNYPLLDKGTLMFILAIGSLGGTISLTLLYILPYFDVDAVSTQTLVFTYLTIGQLLFVFPARKLVCHSEKNPYLLYAILLGVGLQICALTIPVISQLLNVTGLDYQLIFLVVLMCSVSWFIANLIGSSIGRKFYSDYHI